MHVYSNSYRSPFQIICTYNLLLWRLIANISLSLREYQNSAACGHWIPFKQQTSAGWAIWRPSHQPSSTMGVSSIHSNPSPPSFSSHPRSPFVRLLCFAFFVIVSVLRYCRVNTYEIYCIYIYFFVAFSPSQTSRITSTKRNIVASCCVRTI